MSISGTTNGTQWTVDNVPTSTNRWSITLSEGGGSTRSVGVKSSEAHAILAALIAALCPFVAVTSEPAPSPDDTGPRWGKPPVECTWLGRADHAFDVWLDAAGACIYTSQYNPPSQAYPRASVALSAVGRFGDSPWSATLALLDAATAKPEAKAERVVVGYRVRDSEGDCVVRDGGSMLGWAFVTGPPRLLARNKALDLLKRCRAWAGEVPAPDRRITFRLYRVTRAAKAKGVGDV